MQTIKEILRVARDAGASDVHITAGSVPKMRVQGQLISMEFPRMLPADTEGFLGEIMDEAQRVSFESKGEADLSFSISDEGRYRVNAYRQRGSAAIAIRLVGARIPSARELGMPESVLGLSDKRRGLVLVAGPAGSGKSTTLAALIDRINDSRECNIITLEDPIEYLHSHKKSMVNQREIGLDSESFQSALRSALREDPDVILVGELRDPETISMALTAAETGHLVLSALHTRGAANTIDRIVEVFPVQHQQQIRVQLSGVLEAIVSQQLISRADNFGRVTAFEVLLVNQAVRSLIREGKYYQLMTVRKTDRRGGMLTMDESLIQLCHEGRISRDAAISSAVDPEGMRSKLF